LGNLGWMFSIILMHTYALYLKTLIEYDLNNEKNLNNGKLDYTVIQEVMDFGIIDLEASLRLSSYKFSGSFPNSYQIICLWW
jgi:hypothetical protein